ncbi:MAG TPA: fumarylacetoacetate hydrolase family protein [Vicinamibacterales bacterium]|nr:fumarylacetoacetate hydrolase family protein [Vicinamibacterales bacterium]
MDADRRMFLKTTAAGVASATAATLAPGLAAATTVQPAAFEMPRNLTLLNMRTAAGPRLGVKQPRGILDVAAAAAMYTLPAPVDTDDLLQNGKGGLLARVVAAAADGPARLYLQETAVRHAPLVTRPEKIIMMGFNYRRHAAETGTPIPANPTLFNKYNNSLNHHGGTIALPTAAARHFDHEIELVMVFGRECHNVSEADALDYVAGYCTGNDFSARDLQYLTTQFMIGKTFDGFAPLGPYLVTSDLVGDPNNLRLECRVNGEQRQDWNTSDMIFNCRQMISFASRMMTIKPGDIFFTGTPHGVVFGKPKAEQVWLKAGDRVVCSVEKLGELAFSLT